MRLEPLAVYILERFSEHHKASLRLTEIIDGCTVNRRNALKDALAQLADEHGLIRRSAGSHGEVLQLTDEGKEFVGLAAADAGEHIPHSS